MDKEIIRKEKESLRQEIIEMFREQANLLRNEGKDNHGADRIEDCISAIEDIEILNTYTISQTSWGRYTQRTYVEIKAKSKEDALRQYENMKQEQKDGYSNYDYDCEDGDEIEIS